MGSALGAPRRNRLGIARVAQLLASVARLEWLDWFNRSKDSRRVSSRSNDLRVTHASRIRAMVDVLLACDPMG
jgi:hypothetical protein